MNPEPSQGDLAKMQALQQKRTLAFVNHCVITNVQCLNNFMQVCEEKLMLFERKLDRVDAAMVLLESKLLSVPEVSALISEVNETKVPPLEPIHEDTSNTVPSTISPSIQVPCDTALDTPDCTVTSRPEYDRFVKMVQVGVPMQAAKLKCSLEGLNPDILSEMLGK